MKTTLLVVLLCAALGLSACGKATVSPSESRPATPPAAERTGVSVSAAHSGDRPVVWEPVMGTDVGDLRVHAPFAPVIPDYLPNGFALRHWSVSAVSNGETGPATVVVALRFDASGEASVTVLESEGDLKLPLEAPIIKGDLGGSIGSFWFSTTPDGKPQTSVVFGKDDIHHLVIGQNLGKDEVIRIAGSMVQAESSDIGHDTSTFQGLAPGDRRELEAASAEQLVRIHLNAINQKQYDKAVACVDNRFISAADEPRFREYLTRTTAISDIIIRQYTTDDVAGPTPFPYVSAGLHFDVLYREVSDLAPDGTVNNRFFDVVRDSEDGRWRILGIATSP